MTETLEQYLRKRVIDQKDTDELVVPVSLVIDCIKRYALPEEFLQRAANNKYPYYDVVTITTALDAADRDWETGTTSSSVSF